MSDQPRLDGTDVWERRLADGWVDGWLADGWVDAVGDMGDLTHRLHPWDEYQAVQDCWRPQPWRLFDRGFIDIYGDRRVWEVINYQWVLTNRTVRIGTRWARLASNWLDREDYVRRQWVRFYWGRRELWMWWTNVGWRRFQ